ncbi:hypothetical protein Tco_0723717, partial [Tanacetum coccineum]
MAASDNGKFLVDEDMSFKKISPLAEEIIVMIRKRIQKTKATSYNAKLMNQEDDTGWYTNEMRAQTENIVDDLRDIAYYIVEKTVKNIHMMNDVGVFFICTNVVLEKLAICIQQFEQAILSHPQIVSQRN